jgi:glutathione peroxidase
MSILDAPIARLDGTAGTLRDLTGGNAALLVNVASRCGLTPQYTSLEQLQEKYAHRGFTVVGLPCNQFGGQEPGTSEEIAEFCSATYGVSFPLTEKVDVNGEHRHPVYAGLVDTPNEKGVSGDVTWNFEKFLLDPVGVVVARFRPTTAPDDERVLAAIEAVLG